jgi:hypothetical protein
LHAWFDCPDCGVNTETIGEHYVVEDPDWQAAGAPKGMLCIGCLEARLKRRLTLADFRQPEANAYRGKSPSAPQAHVGRAQMVEYA